DPGHLLHAEVLEAALDHAAPALEDGDRVPALGIGAAHDGPDDRIQAGAVAPAGEHADRLRHSVLVIAAGPGPRGRDRRFDAAGGTRTHTSRRTMAFEAIASTNCATAASVQHCRPPPEPVRACLQTMTHPS